MRVTGIKKNPKTHKHVLFLLLLYIPVSCSLIGLLAYQMRSPSPVSGSYLFLDVFWHYANPFNSDFSNAHMITIGLSLAYLLFMAVTLDSSKPVVSIFHIRIFLLIPIVLITLIVMLLVALGPAYSTPQDIIRLFLYVDIHLILLMLISYLPFFRKLKPTSVISTQINEK